MEPVTTIVSGILCAGLMLWLWQQMEPLPNGIAHPCAIRMLELMGRLWLRYPVRAFALLGMDKQRILHVRRVIATIGAAQSSIAGLRFGRTVRISTDCVRSVPVRVYMPVGGGDIKTKSASAYTLPCLVYLHGGGFVLQRPHNYDMVLCRLAAELRVVVVAVRYRLGPEHRFPAAVDDCIAVTTSLLQSPHSFGGAGATTRPDRVFVAGDSAGGNLAAVVAQHCADREAVDGMRPLRGQILIYPVMQLLDLRSSSYQYYHKHLSHTGLLSSYQVVLWLLSYLGADASEENIRLVLDNRHVSEAARREHEVHIAHAKLPQSWREPADYAPPSPEYPPEGDKKLSEHLTERLFDWRFSPVMRKTLPAALCDALVCTCGFDVLRDDGYWYAERLKAAGVPTEWSHHASGVHGVFAVDCGDVFHAMLGDMSKFIECRV